MKTWEVTLPIVGHISLVVVAETESEAIEKALDTQWEWDDIVVAEAMKQVVRGNVFRGSVNHASARELPE